VLDMHNRVVGLHHIGGCTAADRHNKAVLMSKILPLLPLSDDFIAGDIGCGSNGCVDAWRIGCASPHTNCVVAHACVDDDADSARVSPCWRSRPRAHVGMVRSEEQHRPAAPPTCASVDKVGAP
jgi:hypothetical protein